MLERSLELDQREASLQERDTKLQERDTKLQERDSNLQQRHSKLQQREPKVQQREIQVKQREDLRQQQREQGGKIVIKKLMGKSFEIDVKLTDTIATIKQQIHSCEQIPPSSQRLIASGQELSNDNSTLMDCNLGFGALIHLILRLF